MIRIQIADDEILARFALRTFLEKHFSNIEIIEESKNGKEAVKAALRLNPDLIVMDVRMPVMDGLEASQEILSKNPDAVIIIVSAYDNFPFLQTAVEIGIRGYFLKPLNEDVVLPKFTSIINYLESTHSDGSKKSNENIDSVKQILVNELIKLLIQGSDLETIGKLSDITKTDVDNGYFILLILKDLNSNRINNIEKMRNLKETIISAVKKSLEFQKPGLVGEFYANTLPILIPLAKNQSRSYELSESKFISYEIISRLSRIFDVKSSIIVGRTCSKPYEFSSSYKEALSISPALDAGEIVFAKEYTPKKTTQRYPYNTESRLIQQIKSRETESAKKTANQLISYVFQNNDSYVQIHEYVSQYFVSLKRAIFQLGIDVDAIDSFAKLRDIAYITELDELETYTRYGTDTLLDIISQQNDNRNFALIQRIKKYIGENQLDSISLEQLAKELNLSIQYVSKLFKETFGVTFIDYITNQRIDLAKELLKNSNNNVAQVSKKVGYADQNYFCRIFKKTTGMTPKEYKILARGVENEY